MLLARYFIPVSRPSNCYFSFHFGADNTVNGKTNELFVPNRAS